jgi:hypothetical protein
MLLRDKWNNGSQNAKDPDRGILHRRHLT